MLSLSQTVIGADGQKTAKQIARKGSSKGDCPTQAIAWPPTGLQDGQERKIEKIAKIQKGFVYLNLWN